MSSTPNDFSKSESNEVNLSEPQDDPFDGMEEAAFIAKGYCELAIDALEGIRDSLKKLSDVLKSV